MKISKVNTVVISDEPQSIKNVTTSVKSIMLLRKKNRESQKPSP